MNSSLSFDVIIIGGSFAGLSAAMSLGRSLRSVLVLDSGSPCNKPTPHSHNFIIHDGEAPADISQKAKSDVLKYQTILFRYGLAVRSFEKEGKFIVVTDNGDQLQAKKLLFASGLADILPAIPGFRECWGKSLVHCPYCHGYEWRNKTTGIFFNGDIAFDLSKLVRNLTSDLIIFTNGNFLMTQEQHDIFKAKGIPVVQEEILELDHNDGYLKNVILQNGNKISLDALYIKPEFRQHCELPQQLGCEIENGLLKIDNFQKTTVKGIFAAGDNSSFIRSVAFSVAAGNLAGAAINKELANEEF